MGLVDGLKTFFGGKLKKIDGSFFYPSNSRGEIDLSKPSRVELEEHAYGQSAAAWTVVNRVAELCASIRPVVKDRDIERLLFTPNNNDSFRELMYRAIAEYLTTGTTFFVGANNLGELSKNYTEIIVPRTSKVLVNNDFDYNIKGYTISYFNRSFQSEPKDVLTIKRPDITQDTHYGFSGLMALKYIWKANTALSENDYYVHYNRGTDSILYTEHNPGMPESERKEIQDHVDQVISGRARVGKRHYSPVPVKVTNLGVSPKDLLTNETYLQHLRAFAAMVGAPPQFFGDPTASTYNNMKEAKRSMYEDCVLPTTTLIFNELSEWLKTEITYDAESIPALSRNNSEYTETLISQINAGIITPGEAREILYPNK